ncbi:hypothetical protein LXA43DRAFT_1067601 [Ganoderma leucocontextum]|nr:hypothetical protein LXA43DRAFT_1067601 [Ganoderma leucocontextum]
MPRPSDFSDADEQYLVSQHADYRRTPAAEKDAFRDRCAKHIIRLRELADDDVYIVDLFHNKVRNWFQNNAPVKKTRLPIRINNVFHPERVYGMKHKDDIRVALQESRADDGDDDSPYVVQWNAMRKEMWTALSAEERVIFERLAAQWSEEGPDEDMKPEMAERRAVAWMKAVTLLFWQQCGMPIFIYGCYEDTKAELQGATFDTSLLLEDTAERKGKPTFRQSKEWATDFRRYFYQFFTPYIRPDLASPDAMEYLRTTSKRVVEPFDFEEDDSGWPLLPVGTGVPHQRRQEILRLWFKDLYGIFFDDGMLPANFELTDPSHIRRGDLIKFFEHVNGLQHPNDRDGPPQRFQFAHYEAGPENNRRYPEAINDGNVAAWQPRRSKKTVRAPTFDAVPGGTDSEGNERPEEPKKAAKRGRFNPDKKFYKHVEKLRKEKERSNARKARDAAKAAKVKAKAKGKKKGKGKSKVTVASDEELWKSDEEDTPEEEEIDDFEAADHDVPADESELSEEEVADGDRSPVGAGDAGEDDSGDEVEEALERPSSRPGQSASAIRPQQPRFDAAPPSIPSIPAAPAAPAAGLPKASGGGTEPTPSTVALAPSIPGAPAPQACVQPQTAGPLPMAPKRAAQAEHGIGQDSGPADGSRQLGGVTVAPADVPADGVARFHYLKGLDREKAYVDMLERDHPDSRATSDVLGQLGS